MIEIVGQPAYQRIADRLRSQIASGELPVGSAIPSTAQLSKQYGVSITVVRAAINQLRADGLVVGQPGKAVYVRATPEAAARERVQLEDLAAQIKEVRSDVDDLARRDESSAIERLRADVADLRRQLGVFHAQLMDLYSRMGQPYPHEDARVPGRETAPKARRAATGADPGT